MILGVLLTVLGSGMEEAGNSLAKLDVKMRLESILTLGFLSNLWSCIFFTALVLARWPNQHIVAWPTFLLRLPLELIPAWFTLKAISVCSRSAFGFVRVITIPLLLVADTLMGYSLDYFQIAGMGVIIISLFILYMNHGLEKRGLKYAVVAASMPVLTTTILKYNLNQGNSLELEQTVVMGVITLFFLVSSLRHKENPLKPLLKPMVFSQTIAHALGNVVLAFGFNLTLPSIHTAAKRSTSVIASLAAGHMVFHEKKVVAKALGAAACVVGILMLAL